MDTIDAHITYLIVDGHTGAVVGKAKTRKAARRSCDRRDNAYGAIRYRIEVRDAGKVEAVL